MLISNYHIIVEHHNIIIAAAFNQQLEFQKEYNSSDITMQSKEGRDTGGQ